MKSSLPDANSKKSTDAPIACEKRGGAEKITIPSDLRFHPQALSVNVGNPCESPSPKSLRTLACETLAGLCHHTEVLLLVNTPCGVSTDRKLREFQLQPLGIGSGCCQPNGCDTTI